MRPRQFTGFAVGVALAIAAIVPFAIPKGPCNAYAQELGYPDPGNESSPYDMICLHEIGYASWSDDILPIAYFLFLLIAAFGLAFRVSGSRTVGMTVGIAVTGGLLAPIVGFTIAGLDLKLLLDERGMIAAPVFLFLFGLGVRYVDRRLFEHRG